MMKVEQIVLKMSFLIWKMHQSDREKRNNNNNDNNNNCGKTVNISNCFSLKQYA